MSAGWTANELDRLRESGVLHAVEWFAARSLWRLGAGRAAVFAAIAAARADLGGHSCADLPTLAESLLSEQSELRFPALAEWLVDLRADASVGTGGSTAPLILDDAARLYLARNFDHEQCLAEAVRARLIEPLRPAAAAVLADLRLLFDPSAEGEDAAQQRAVAAALGRRLFLLTGGPGTGKTHTVLRLLVLAQRHAPGGDLRMLLAAPTGKAAQRLAEALRQGRAQLQSRLPPGDWQRALDRLPDSASTLHRLLGASGDGRRFRYGREHPLPCELLVVDEASMVDLALMRRLFDALAPHAQLVLVGDADQLASVEAGSVFADLCRAAGARARQRPATAAWLSAATATRIAADEGADPLSESLAVLDRNHRNRPELAALAAAVRAGDRAQVEQRLTTAQPQIIDWQTGATSAELYRRLETWVDPRSGHGLFDGLRQAADAASALQALARFRLLCGLRVGRLGSVALNGHIERLLRRRLRVAPGVPWYRGRPLMITRNDAALGVVNGDVGVVWPAGDGTLQLFLRDAEGVERWIALSALPDHESCYAMSVHKAQGSEFDQVVVVLPEQDLPLLNRELIYTAVTRARQALGLWATAAALRQALARRQHRDSGLIDALHAPGASADERGNGKKN